MDLALNSLQRLICHKTQPTIKYRHGDKRKTNSLTKKSRRYYSVCFLRVLEEAKVVAGQIVVASIRQYTYSQRPGRVVIPGREEHRRTRTNSLFRFYAVWLSLFSLVVKITKKNRFDGVEATKIAMMAGPRNIPEASLQQCKRNHGRNYFVGEAM